MSTGSSTGHPGTGDTDAHGRGGDHPGTDELADLAADVLADVVGEARAQALREHVATCTSCQAVVDDATRPVEPPSALASPPMPDDVWARVSAAVAHERTRTGEGEPAGTPPTSAPSAIPTVVPAARPALRRAGRRRPAPVVWTTRPPGTRPAAKPSRESGPPRVLLALAAAVVVLTAGGLTVRALLPSSDVTAQDSVAAASAPPGAGGTAILATGTNYTKSALAAQIRSLVTQARAGGAAPDAPATAPTRGEAPMSGSATGDPAGEYATGKGSGGDDSDAAAEAAPGGAPAPQAARPSSGALAPGRSSAGTRYQLDDGDKGVMRVWETPAGGEGVTLLRDPKALRRCVEALAAPGVQPIAVDLARYQGRDAALLVLPGAGGGYEIWAVARDCRPGADGTLGYAVLDR